MRHRLPCQDGQGQVCGITGRIPAPSIPPSRDICRGDGVEGVSLLMGRMSWERICQETGRKSEMDDAARFHFSLQDHSSGAPGSGPGSSSRGLHAGRDLAFSSRRHCLPHMASEPAPQTPGRLLMSGFRRVRPGPGRSASSPAPPDAFPESRRHSRQHPR